MPASALSARVRRTGSRVVPTAIALAALLALALPVSAATVTLPAQTLQVPLQGLSLPLPVQGRLSYPGEAGRAAQRDDPVPVEAQLSADLRALQQRATEVIGALVDRNDSCGDRIHVTSGRLGAQAPALRLAADFNYERAACFGERRMQLVPQQPVSVDMLLEPVISGRSLRFRATVLSLRSRGQEMPQQMRALVAAQVADRLDREMEKLLGSAMLPSDAVLTGLAFDEAKAGRLAATAAGQATLSPAQFNRLLALRPR